MFLPLELTLRPSRIYMAALAMAHGFGLVAVCLAALPLWAQVALTMALTASVIWAWREISGSPHGLRVSRSGQIEVLGAVWQPARISGRPVVLPWLVSLRLKPEGAGTCQLTLLADSTDADGMRKLRVWLRWAAPNN